MVRYPSGLLASAAPVELALPDDAADQLAAFIDNGTGEQRDARALAAAIVEFMASAWAQSPADEAAEEAVENPAVGEGAMAAADTAVDEPMPDNLPHERGKPDDPQLCALCGEPATHSLVSAAGDQYTPTCDACDEAARAEIEAGGEEIGNVVPIGPADEQAKEETP